MYKIRDLRNSEKDRKDRDAEELAHQLGIFAMIVDCSPHQIGGVIKKIRDRFDFSILKSSHTKKDRIL